MAIIKVGEDDSTFGLFGHKRTTVEFSDAIKMASSGDTIQIQAGYRVPTPFGKNNNYFIDKDLTIVGEDSKSNSSIIESSIVICNANVIINNITFQSKENYNIISLVQNADVKCIGVNIYNEIVDTLKVATLSIDPNCKLEFDNGYIAGGMKSINPDYSHIYIKGIAKIYNSKIEDRLVVKNGQLTVVNSEISYEYSNAIFGTASIINIESTDISGGYESDNGTFPCVKLKASNVNIKHSCIVQPGYDAALQIETNSSVLGDSLSASSISMLNSKLELINTCRLLQSLSVEDNSSILGNRVLIDGIDTNMVSLYLTSDSNINVNWIGFGTVKDPVVRMSKNATLDAELQMLEYDHNESSYIINNNTFVLAENPKVPIEYIEDSNVPATNSDSSNEEDEIASVEENNNEEITDITDDFSSSVSAEEELKKMIGLANVKKQVKEFVAVATINKKRVESGLSASSQTLHSIFAGNPGTGKTTVARLLGQLLYEKGVIKKNLLVEASRTDLVAEYIGQTAPKTRKVLEKALGGVLFIDEAYTLTPESQNDFGGEAIDEILKFMEDHRSEIMIIFAGYSNEMKKFLEVNPGLQSRIPNVFEFEDYTGDELVELGLLSLKNEGFKLNEKLYSEKLKAMYNLTNDHSNGRWVRNFNEVIKRKQAVRLALDDPDSLTEEDLTTILPEDIENITEKF